MTNIYWEDINLSKDLDIRRLKNKFILYQKGTKKSFVFQACEAKIVAINTINDKETDVVFQFLRAKFLNMIDDLVSFCAKKMCTRKGRNAIDEMKKSIKSPIDDNALFVHRLIFDKDGINISICNENDDQLTVNSVTDFQKLFKIGDVFSTFLQIDSLTYVKSQYLYDIGMIQMSHLPNYDETDIDEDDFVDDVPEKVEPPKELPTPIVPPIKELPKDTIPIVPPIKELPKDTIQIVPPIKELSKDTIPIVPPIKELPKEQIPIVSPIKESPKEPIPVVPLAKEEKKLSKEEEKEILQKAHEIKKLRGKRITKISKH